MGDVVRAGLVTILGSHVGLGDAETGTENAVTTPVLGSPSH